MREIGSPGIMRSVSLRLKTAGLGLAPREIAVKLAEIESTTPPYSSMQIAAALGVASGAFAFLNGSAPRKRSQQQSTALLNSVCGLGYRNVSSVAKVLPHCPPLRRQECMS